MRIVWIQEAADSPPDYPNYRRLNWRLVNGVQFPELDYYNIRGLSGMITRSISYQTIRYILGARVKGRHSYETIPTPLSHGSIMSSSLTMKW